MKCKKWLIVLFTLLLPAFLYAQDTISIYFATGKSKIPDNELLKLDFIKKKYDFSALDSIHFIGMADSNGNFKNNLKLSEKRARNVAGHFKDIIPPDVLPKIFSVGESSNRALDENRRVDIILYFPPLLPEEETQDTVVEKISACYYIDYDLLQLCHTRKIIKGKKEFIYIEINSNLGINNKFINPKSIKEYYSGNLVKDGSFRAKKIKWQLRHTGKKWWKRRRYVTIIPRKDFEKYKILKKGQTPCPDCYESIDNIAAFLTDTSCLKEDLFLKENMQAKSAFLSYDKAKVRAPREYINTDHRFYTNCMQTPKLSWQTAKGKRKQYYYYTRLHWHTYELTRIYRAMDCCLDPFPREIRMIHCNFRGGNLPSTFIVAEAGSYYQQSGFNHYAALGLNVTIPYNRFYLLAGIFNDKSFFGAARYQLHLFTLPQLNPISTWQSYRNYKPPKRYGNIYTGAELKTKSGAKEKDFIEFNIHAGIASLNKNENAFLQSIFLQYGVGFDLLKHNSNGLYPVLLTGINANLTIPYWLQRKLF